MPISLGSVTLHSFPARDFGPLDPISVAIERLCDKLILHNPYLDAERETRRPSFGTSAVPDDISPWQENAIRCLEQSDDAGLP